MNKLTNTLGAIILATSSAANALPECSLSDTVFDGGDFEGTEYSYEDYNADERKLLIADRSKSPLVFHEIEIGAYGNPDAPYGPGVGAFEKDGKVYKFDVDDALLKDTTGDSYLNQFVLRGEPYLLPNIRNNQCDEFEYLDFDWSEPVAVFRMPNGDSREVTVFEGKIDNFVYQGVTFFAELTERSGQPYFAADVDGDGKMDLGLMEDMHFILK